MPRNVSRYTGLFAHAGLQRARESALAGNERRDAALLAAHGQRGDQRLVHVDDAKLAAIRDAFAPHRRTGLLNPVTGLESFAPDDEFADGGPNGDMSFAGSNSDGFDRDDSYLPGPIAAASNLLSSIVPDSGDGDGVPPAQSQQLAQAFIPLFARPPILVPRVLRPLEELPKGQAGGPGAGKRFGPSIGEEPGTPCTYCGTPTTKEPGPNRLHRDHIIPRSQGGNNSPENHTTGCQTCNLEKGPRTPEQWYNARNRLVTEDDQDN